MAQRVRSVNSLHHPGLGRARAGSASRTLLAQGALCVSIIFASVMFYRRPDGLRNMQVHRRGCAGTQRERAGGWRMELQAMALLMDSHKFETPSIT